MECNSRFTSGQTAISGCPYVICYKLETPVHDETTNWCNPDKTDFADLSHADLFVISYELYFIFLQTFTVMRTKYQKISLANKLFWGIFS